MFNAGAPDKLIRDVTGHRSTALQLYERPTVQQKQAVSRVLVQGTQNFLANSNSIQKPNFTSFLQLSNAEIEFLFLYSSKLICSPGGFGIHVT